MIDRWIDFCQANGEPWGFLLYMLPVLALIVVCVDICLLAIWKL